MFAGCKEAYVGYEGTVTNAAARILVDADKGTAEGAVGTYITGSPIKNLVLTVEPESLSLRMSGDWNDCHFENILVSAQLGTLHFEIPYEDETGSLYLLFNLRRIGDDAWTDENPKPEGDVLADAAGKNFAQLMEMMGYTEADYPAAAWN